MLILNIIISNSGAVTTHCRPTMARDVKCRSPDIERKEKKKKFTRPQVVYNRVSIRKAACLKEVRTLLAAV